MIWAILAALGVPLWALVGVGLTLYLRAQSLRRRPDDLVVRVRPEGGRRWTPGHAVWVRDVFVFSGTMRFWADVVVPAIGISRTADEHGLAPPRRMADATMWSLCDDDGDVVHIATRADEAALKGPFANGGRSPRRDL